MDIISTALYQLEPRVKSMGSVKVDGVIPLLGPPEYVAALTGLIGPVDIKCFLAPVESGTFGVEWKDYSFRVAIDRQLAMSDDADAIVGAICDVASVISTIQRMGDVKMVKHLARRGREMSLEFAGAKFAPVSERLRYLSKTQARDVSLSDPNVKITFVPKRKPIKRTPEEKEHLLALARRRISKYGGSRIKTT